MPAFTMRPQPLRAAHLEHQFGVHKVSGDKAKAKEYAGQAMDAARVAFKAGAGSPTLSDEAGFSFGEGSFLSWAATGAHRLARPRADRTMTSSIRIMRLL